MLRDKAPFSFLQDASVPVFEPPERFTVMDAQCALCARGATWIAHNDRASAFRIVPVQSLLGKALLRHYGLDPDDPVSWLYVEKGRAFTSLQALIRVGVALGGVWRALVLLRLLPETAQNALYAAVARRRIQLFGTADLCALPDPEVRRRLLT